MFVFDFWGVPGANEEARIYFTVVASTSQQPTSIKDAWQAPNKWLPFRFRRLTA
jgi:hypothetical protein